MLPAKPHFVPKSFSQLTEREILALAVSLEEDDGRILGDFAEQLRSQYPDTARTLQKMQEEESEHRHRLISAYRERFGEYIPLIRREDVRGFVKRRPVWQMKTLSVAQVRRAIDAGLVSADHFSVDGSLIEAYASIKSFKPKDAGDDENNGFKSRNAEVDFHGQKQSNDTHQSTTDPDAKLIRKSDGKPARLCHALHAIVENRHGLVLAVEVNSPLGNSEPATALSLLDRVKAQFKLTPRTVGADKGYGQGPFLEELEKRTITPHVAMKDGPIGGGRNPFNKYHRRKNQPSIQARRRMRRRSRGKGYAISQRCRKKIEEWFGWGKTIAGLARTKLIGHWKTNQQAHVAGAAFNLVRLRGLIA